jgi:hypothetical protein
MARPGEARRGLAGCGPAWHGEARQGEDSLMIAAGHGQAGRGAAGLGWARRGGAGIV